VAKVRKKNQITTFVEGFLCTDDTILPEGSAFFLNASSHSRATGVLQATDGTDGTQLAALSEGKSSEKMVR
jgi:hypothetical protein